MDTPAATPISAAPATDPTSAAPATATVAPPLDAPDLSNNTADGFLSDAEETLSDFMAWVKAKIEKDPAGAKTALAALMSDAEEIGIDAIKSALFDIANFKALNPGTSIAAILKGAGTAIGGLISKL